MIAQSVGALAQPELQSALRRVLGGDPSLDAALAGPDPLRVQAVPARVWGADVSLWWVAVGPLASPTACYVALWRDDPLSPHRGDALVGVILTGSPAAFEAATTASLGRAAGRTTIDLGTARQLGLLFIETTRPMTGETRLLTRESAVDDDRLASLLDLVFTDGRSASERTDLLLRLARLGPEVSPDVRGALLASRALPAHALPAQGLDADERHRLSQSLAAWTKTLERQTGAALGSEWRPLRGATAATVPASAPFGATPLAPLERRAAIETFLDRRESPKVQPLGDRSRFQALVTVDAEVGLLELAFWRDGRLRATWTPLARGAGPSR